MSPEEVQQVLHVGERELCHLAALHAGDEGPCVVSWMLASLRSGSVPGYVRDYCEEVSHHVHSTGGSGGGAQIAPPH